MSSTRRKGDQEREAPNHDDNEKATSDETLNEQICREDETFEDKKMQGGDNSSKLGMKGNIEATPSAGSSKKAARILRMMDKV